MIFHRSLDPTLHRHNFPIRRDKMESFERQQWGKGKHVTLLTSAATHWIRFVELYGWWKPGGEMGRRYRWVRGYSSDCTGEGCIEEPSTEEVQFCHSMYMPLHLEATEREMSTCTGFKRLRFESHNWLTGWPWAKHLVSLEFHPFSSSEWGRLYLCYLPLSLWIIEDSIYECSL